MKLSGKSIVKTLAADRFYPLALLVVVLAAYALQIMRMGLYWDDWQVVFLANPGTPAALWNYFLFDRPFSAWTYILTLPVLGLSPLAWQIFTILLRWLTALGFCWALRGLWPERSWQVFWMSAFFAVYPGFLQQPISVAFSQHFITYALFTFSLGLTIAALRRPRRALFFTLLACLFSLAQLLTMEYFFGLEFLRPLLIFLMLTRLAPGEKFWPQAFKTIKTWLPYLAVLVVFAAWRFVFYPTISAENTPTLLQSLRTSPIGALVQLAQYAGQDFLQISYSAWVNAIQPSMLVDKTLGLFAAALFFALLIAAWFLFNSRESHENQDTAPRTFTLEAVLIGVLGILLGGLPVWSTNRQVIVGLWSDRFTLAPLFGASILLVALIDWLVRSRGRQTVVLAFLLFTALLTQNLNVDRYAANWQVQRDFYWQLFWRAPALKPGTAVLAPKLPTSYISDYAVGFGLNAMYAPERDAADSRYWFLIAPRAAGDKFAGYEPGLPIEYTLRNVTFIGSTSDSLGLSFAAGRTCLRVLDPVYLEAPTRLGDDLGGIERDMYPVSNVDRIERSEASAPPSDVFGAEPEHTWCYFYEKADLARQFKDWQTVVDLAQQAEAAGQRTKEGPELLPFIEGYAQVGEWDKAVETTSRANVLTAMMQPVLCKTWQRIITETPSSGARSRALASIQDSLSCPSSDE